MFDFLFAVIVVFVFICLDVCFWFVCCNDLQLTGFDFLLMFLVLLYVAGFVVRFGLCCVVSLWCLLLCVCLLVWFVLLLLVLCVVFMLRGC